VAGRDSAEVQPRLRALAFDYGWLKPAAHVRLQMTKHNWFIHVVPMALADMGPHRLAGVPFDRTKMLQLTETELLAYLLPPPWAQGEKWVTAAIAHALALVDSLPSELPRSS
jgi:hypothetical protein